MEPTTVRLDSLIPGDFFKCPWNGKTFELQGITPSAAWVKVEEDVEFEIKDRKTGLMKTVRTKKKKNEPWSRATRVEIVKNLQEPNGN